VMTLTAFGNEVYDLNARYSPDGSEIAFAGFNRDGVRGAVYVMDADGSDIRRVTGPHLGAFGPDWSPDGSTLAMSTHCCERASAAIASIGPYGGNLTTLTDPGESLDFSPSWAPEGDAIIFERDAPDFSRFDTWIMAPDGSGATLLKRNAGEAVWGPAL
jgi:TolB protein